MTRLLEQQTKHVESIRSQNSDLMSENQRLKSKVEYLEKKEDDLADTMARLKEEKQVNYSGTSHRNH